MNIILRSLTKPLLILLLAMGTGTFVAAQQLALSNAAIYRPEMINPGYLGFGDLSNVYLGHQQRNLADFNWRTMSQFLYFKSKPGGKSDNFGWGAYVTNDFEHTERRLSLGFNMAVRLFESETTYLATGFNIGLINWGSNYSDFRVFDRTDDLLFRPTNFADLDAGIGLSFGVDNFYFRTDINVWANQLPGSLLSKSSSGIALYPHLYGGANFLFNISPDVYLGPSVFYRDIFTSKPEVTNIGGGFLDAGLRIDFDRPQMWFGAGWRIDNAAATGAFGLQVVSTDTLGTRAQTAYFADLVVSGSYPLSGASVFGPTIEIGLNVQLGRVGRDGPLVDSLGLLHGAFWVNNGNMNTHKERRLIKTSPPGLFSESLVGTREVDLTYEWEDNQLLYCGSAIEVKGDSAITSLGDEWIGVNFTLENLISEVIDEGLIPTNVGVADIDSVEPLKEFVRMKVISNLRFDEIQAEFGAEGTVYNGEFVPDKYNGDTLTINFQYGDRYEPADTFVRVWKGKLLSNLELAALKVHAMDLKLVYELKRKYSSRYVFYREGSRTPESDKLFVELGKPLVIPRNVNLSVFQKTEIQLGFIRELDWKPTPKTGRAAKKNKQPKEKKGKGGRKVRDGFRERVPDGSEGRINR